MNASTMMPLMRGSAQARTLSIVGDRYRFLASGEDTAGVYTLFDCLISPGGGPPPHVHEREDELFYVIEGEVIFTIDGTASAASAGTLIQAPRNVPHAFVNQSGTPARMLCMIMPAGLEKFFMEVGTSLASPDADPLPMSEAEMKRIAEAAPRYGLRLLVGP